MANEIKYQINGQLADNTVTVDNKEDMILVPVSIGSADENRIIAELKAEDSGLREETIRHVFDLQKRVIKRMLMTGMSVNTGLYYASVAFRGVIENSTWNPAKNSIVVNFNVGADLREAIKETTVGIIGEKGSAMYIGGVQDACPGEIAPFSLLMAKGKHKNVTTEILLDENIPAPIHKGEKIGSVRYLENGKILAEESILAAQDVDKIGFFGLFCRMLSIYLLK